MSALALVPSAEQQRQRRSPRKPKGDVMLTRQQTAELLGFVEAHATDRAMKKHPTFPRPLYSFSRSPRWLRRDVESWLRARAKAAQRREVMLERIAR